MKEAEYSAYNTRTIVQDEFDPTHIPYIVPMYVRAGAIIPTVEIEQYVGEKNEKGMPNTITLNIYPGEQGEYTMYLDDGVSSPSQPELFKQIGIDPQANGEYREVHISHQWTDKRTRRITVSRVHDGYTPKYEKYFCLAVLHDPSDAEAPVENIKLNGTTITKVETKEAFESTEADVWYFNPTERVSYVKVMDDRKEALADVIYNERKK